jgi:hypothetical protein
MVRGKLWNVTVLIVLLIQLTEHSETSDSSSTEQCDMLLQKCRGMDTTQIIDDEGLLQKTLSVENSFRRGTVRSMESVQHALDDLLRRLPLLLNDRTSWARCPDMAFPTTIRVTIRMVDRSLEGTKRRPFVTKSKQTSMTNGKALIQETDPSKQTILLKPLVSPLLDQLLSVAVKTNSINVTRLNIAVANFQDVSSRPPPISSGQTLLSAALQKRGSEDSGHSQTPVKRARVIYQTPPCSSSQSVTGVSLVASVKPTSFDSTMRTNPLRDTSSRKPNKMKATRIDNFFHRKQNR